MSDFKMNMAIQLLPIDTEQNRWQVIDRAIAIIKASGLSFKVCPFETVIEGTSTQLFSLVESIKINALENSNEILINIKIHAANRDLFFEDKLEKY